VQIDAPEPRRVAILEKVYNVIIAGSCVGIFVQNFVTQYNPNQAMANSAARQLAGQETLPGCVYLKQEEKDGFLHPQPHISSDNLFPRKIRVRGLK
jgi:hypothetical protein